MTKSLNYWKNVYQKESLHGDLFRVSVEDTSHIWDQYDNGKIVTPEKDKENRLKLNAVHEQEKQAQSTLNIIYKYACQGSHNSYGKSLQQAYFGKHYFRFFLACDKPYTMHEMTAQQIVDRVAGIINGKPIYHDGDFAKILSVIRANNESINLNQFNIVKRPSLFTRFFRLFSVNQKSKPEVQDEKPKIQNKR